MRLAAYACALLAAAPVSAQSASTMTNADCLQSYAVFVDVMERNQSALDRSGAARLTADGWCSVSDVRFDFDETAEVRVARLDWRIDGFDRLAEELPPTALSLRATGVGYVPRVDDPVLNYLFDVQYGASEIAARLDIGWDAASQSVLLRTAEVTFSEGNRIATTALIEGIDLTDQERLRQSTLSAAVRRLTIDVESNGLFEQYFAFPIGAALLEGSTDPEADVAAYRAAAQTALDGLLTTVMNVESVDALDRLIADLPRPAGWVRIVAESDDGVRALQLAPLARGFVGLSFGQFLTSLPGLRVSIDYTKSG